MTSIITSIMIHLVSIVTLFSLFNYSISTIINFIMVASPT